jgi:hypothetical protein
MGGIAWSLHKIGSDVTPNIAQVSPEADMLKKQLF